MKLFNKFPVALILTILVVLGCGSYAMTHDKTASNTPNTTSQRAELPVLDKEDWVCDAANVLSDATEESIREWNRKLDSKYYAYLTVATVPSTEGWDVEDYVLTIGQEWGLGSGDFLVVMDIGAEDVYLYEGGDYPDFDYYSCLITYVQDPFLAGDYDTAALNLFDGVASYLNSIGRTPSNYEDYTNGTTQWDYAPSTAYNGESSSSFGLIGFLMLLIILLLIFRAIDQSRYDTWYHSYGHMPHPPVIYRPIFFWHHFSSRPPMPPRGEFSNIPPMGGSPRPRNSGSYNSRPHSRPNAPRSGSRPSSSRGGGFGSSRPSAPRGGSFGGHGGGFGGSRGGSSHGGSFGGGHGGGFGGGGGRGGHR